MERYNIKPEILSALKEIAAFKRVSTEYPSDWSKLPACIYSTKAKPSKYDLSNDEVLTEWHITIDLYHTNSLTSLSESVIEKMKRLGLKNIADNDGNVGNVNRKILTFRGVVDNNTLYVYQ